MPHLRRSASLKVRPDEPAKQVSERTRRGSGQTLKRGGTITSRRSAEHRTGIRAGAVARTLVADPFTNHDVAGVLFHAGGAILLGHSDRGLRGSGLGCGTAEDEGGKGQ